MNLVDYLMDYMGWQDIWHPNPGQWFMGVWTGPQDDLLCIKKCRTREEANRFLSPEGKSIDDACIKAMKMWLETRP